MKFPKNPKKNCLFSFVNKPAGVQVVISWQFKFIYVWHPKTSSSRVMEALKTTFCQEAECKTHEIQQVYPHVSPRAY